MALPRFFSRAYSSVGPHLGVTRGQLEQVLSDTVVGIHLPASCRTQGNPRWLAEMLTNLLARFYPALALTGDDQSCEHAASIAKAINPEIDIRGLRRQGGVRVYVQTGRWSPGSFVARADGWVASILGEALNAKAGLPNPYSSGAAAALAAARLFQTIFAQRLPLSLPWPDTSLSLLDFSTSEGIDSPLPAIDLGEVAVAGLGAVGNPAIWALARHSELLGTLHLIDPEDVELSNLQRYCLCASSDVELGKTFVAQRELKGTRIEAMSWPCTIGDFAQNFQEGAMHIPTICVSVDNIVGRRTAQALLPKLVVNGWTSESGLGTSWHRFVGDSACLGCLYHPKTVALSQTELAARALGLAHDKLAMLWVSEKPLEFEELSVIGAHLGIGASELSDWRGKRVQDVYTGVVCGQVGLDLTGAGKISTVPLAHQSVLAGVLMAAELVKHSDRPLEARSPVAPLTIWDDVLRPPPKYWTVMRKKEPECFCGDEDYIVAYREKWAN